MIQKMSIVFVIDNCGVRKSKVIHNYGGFRKKFSKPGNFLKASVRVRKYNYFWLKNKRIYVPKRGKKFKSYFVRSVYMNRKRDGSHFFFKTNSIVFLKKRLTMYGKFVKGPFVYGLNRKKIIKSFAGLI